VRCVLDELKRSAKDAGIWAFLILTIDRRHTIQEATQVMELAARYRSEGVVGIDLAGDPKVPCFFLFYFSRIFWESVNSNP
jgi:adenosine deaminase